MPMTRPRPANRACALLIARRSYFALTGLFIAAAVCIPVAGQSSAGKSEPLPGSPATPKADAKEAKAAFDKGMKAEKGQDWSAAYSAYSIAVNLEPKNEQYQFRREIARSQLVQIRVDNAEKDAVAGQFDNAARELLKARQLDPSNPTVNERLTEVVTAAHPEENKIQERDISGEVHLEYHSGEQKIDYRGDTRGAYEDLARRFGVEVAFDQDLISRNIHFRIDDAVDFLTALRLLGNMTGTFWRPLTRHLFFVAQDTTQKRKDYAASAVRTILLPASETPDQMTEILRTVREITGITRSDLDVRSRTLTLRASPQAIAVATDLIDSLEQPRGELILEMEILEVDRNYATQLGITPPQSAKVFSLSSAQIQQAEQSESGLIDVINQVLGGTSSGLIPPVIVFGGGISTYFAILPGVSANFAEMLSLVRQGRRVLLRAEDGEPATFFVGDRIPVSLASFSPSLTARGTIPTSNITNPITNYSVGNDPVSIVQADFHDALGTSKIDLAVANKTDDTISILQGNGDGTFRAQKVVSLPTGFTPTALTTANLTSSGHKDLIVTGNVANSATGAVLVLLGNGDGTFNETTQSPLKVGNDPVFVVTNDFNSDGFQDIAIANQGDNTISFFLGNGDGTFKMPPPSSIFLPAGSEPTSLAAADLNGDGKIDLVSANKGSNNISVFFGNGNGTFQAPTNYATGNSPVYVALADFNNQGALDIAVANNGAPSSNNGGNSVTIYYNQISATDVPTGSFVAGKTRDFLAGNGPSSIATGDYNLDGFADLAVTDQNDNAVTILFNAANQTFTAAPEIPVGTAPVSIVTADFNGDGRSDAAIADSGSAEATVILNTTNLLGSGSPGSNGTPFPGVQYLDVGLKVKATPRIHLGDEVTLQLSFELSSITNQNLNSIPVINTENVDQTVRVKQDQTAVLAGFFQSQLTSALTGNPGIAEIPGVGLIDQNQNNQRQGSELVILVTPRMVRLAPHENRAIYAGKGVQEGAGRAETPANIVPLAPPPQQLQQPGPGPLVQPPPGQAPELQAPPQPPEQR
jgi:type II secretory pathway component GspD/PulD (secretin)